MKKEVKTRLKIPEIILKLGEYNDIFSDFDPRQYSQKSLSVDFLEEVDRASRDKGDVQIELGFLLPKNKRNRYYETQIKKRLKLHFKHHFENLKKEKNGLIKRGFLFIFSGVLLMFLATLILFKYQGDSIITTFLVILFEPGGWFLFWEGLNQVIFEPKHIKPKLDFYKKMNKSRIDFFSE